MEKLKIIILTNDWDPPKITETFLEEHELSIVKDIEALESELEFFTPQVLLVGENIICEDIGLWTKLENLLRGNRECIIDTLPNKRVPLIFEMKFINFKKSLNSAIASTNSLDLDKAIEKSRALKHDINNQLALAFGYMRKFQRENSDADLKDLDIVKNALDEISCISREYRGFEK